MSFKFMAFLSSSKLFFLNKEIVTFEINYVIYFVTITELKIVYEIL
jgi:hypothetical protein